MSRATANDAAAIARLQSDLAATRRGLAGLLLYLHATVPQVLDEYNLRELAKVAGLNVVDGGVMGVLLVESTAKSTAKRKG